MTTQEKDAFVRLHLAVLIAGGTGLFGRLINIGELPLVCLRVVLGAAVLAAVMQLRILRSNAHATALPEAQLPNHTAKKNEPSPFCPGRKTLLQIMGCGVILSIHWVFYYGSIKAANVSIGAVCFALVGFFTAIIEPLITRHRPSPRELLLGAFSVAGIGLIFGLDPRYRLGIGLGIVSSLLYVFFSIFSKRVQSQSGQSSSTMLLYEMVGGALVLSVATPLYSTLFPAVSIVPTSRDWVFLLVFASIFTVAPFLLQLQALRHISAFTVNLTYNLEPVYTILLAMLIFGEASELNFSFYLGILLIIASVVLQTKGKDR